MFINVLSLCYSIVSKISGLFVVFRSFFSFHLCTSLPCWTYEYPSIHSSPESLYIRILLQINDSLKTKVTICPNNNITLLQELFALLIITGYIGEENTYKVSYSEFIMNKSALVMISILPIHLYSQALQLQAEKDIHL